jgi:hypothetical protein
MKQMKCILQYRQAGMLLLQHILLFAIIGTQLLFVWPRWFLVDTAEETRPSAPGEMPGN